MLEQMLASGAPSMQLAGAQVRYDPAAPVGRRVRKVTLPGGRTLKRDAEVVLATDLPTVGGAGGLAVLGSLVYQREGLIDVEAVASLLRRLPAPVEIAHAPAFVSTRAPVSRP
jgi:hypothetical protein